MRICPSRRRRAAGQEFRVSIPHPQVRSGSRGCAGVAGSACGPSSAVGGHVAVLAPRNTGSPFSSSNVLFLFRVGRWDSAAEGPRGSGWRGPRSAGGLGGGAPAHTRGHARGAGAGWRPRGCHSPAWAALRGSGSSSRRLSPTMVFESVVADLLNRFLGDYVENLNKSQLKLGIWGGE